MYFLVMGKKSKEISYPFFRLVTKSEKSFQKNDFYLTNFEKQLSKLDVKRFMR